MYSKCTQNIRPCKRAEATHEVIIIIVHAIHTMWSLVTSCKACIVYVCECVCECRYSHYYICSRFVRESKVQYFTLGRSKSKVCFRYEFLLWVQHTHTDTHRLTHTNDTNAYAEKYERRRQQQRKTLSVNSQSHTQCCSLLLLLAFSFSHFILNFISVFDVDIGFGYCDVCVCFWCMAWRWVSGCISYIVPYTNDNKLFAYMRYQH